MRTVAFLNQKGGSGKTSAAVNLAAALGEQGKRVLLVDLDPEAHATRWLLGPEGEDRCLFDLLTEGGKLADLARETGVELVDMVPASEWLVRVDRTLAGEPGAELVLRRALERLPADRWDFVLLDCPPASGLLTVSALAAVGELVVPVPAEIMALTGLGKLLRTVELVQERVNPGLTVSGVLICRVDGRSNLSREVVEDLRRRFGRQVFRAVIPETVRMRECPGHRQPITMYAPQSPASVAYRAAAGELARRGQRELTGHFKRRV